MTPTGLEIVAALLGIVGRSSAAATGDVAAKETPIANVAVIEIVKNHARGARTPIIN